MGYITTTFLGKDYTIPEDVLVYIDLLDFTDSVKTQLVNTFVRKLKDEIKKDNIGLLGDEDLASEVERQVGRFIAKLCDNGIFSRTINDYWKNNKGYQLYSDVNKAALEKMKSLLIQEMDAWQAGYENAVNRAESHVTGMGFSIWSSSFVNHAIYAAMEASTLNKQSKEAEAQYQRDMSDLRSRLDSQYGGEKSKYINNTYIPNMEAALTVFAYELLDKYVADLIANGKFDRKTLDYVDISRSNDLLKNLALSANKKAIIESAFAACPYNTAVYMQAMKHDLLDYDSFQSAKVFKQGDTILSFLKENCGKASFPTQFNINYYCVGLLASLTGKTSEDYLRVHTEQYATGIVKAYARVAEMIADKDRCRKVIGECKENAILEDDSICRHKARSYVNPIAPDSIWNQLTEQCGQKDLLKRIKKYIPQDIPIESKADADKYFTEQLFAAFEVARKGLADGIIRKRQEEEERRKEELRRKQEAERIREEKRQKQVETNRKAFKVLMKVAAGLLAVVIIYFAVLFVNDTVIGPAKQYKAAIALMEAGDYQSARDTFVSLDGYKNSEAMIEQCNAADIEAAYNAAIQMMDEQEYAQAIIAFEALDGYKDSANRIIECRYLINEGTHNEAIELIQNEEYEKAIDILLTLDNFESSDQYLREARYGYALQLMAKNKYIEAVNLFDMLGTYEDSGEKLKESKHGYALQLMDDELYEDALSILAELSDYAPAQNSMNECRYQLAMKYISQYDYQSARAFLESITGYKDASSYKKLLDGIISKVYYNDEYRGTHYIWVVSKIDVGSCTEKLYFYECRDDLGLDDEFVDYYQGYDVQWKTSGTTIFASSDGQEVENGYTLYNLSAGRNILTSQYISTDGEAKVIDTYKLMPDGRAQYIKEEWVSYLKNNESDDAWKTALATIDIIDNSSNVERTSDGIEFYVNGLKWNMPNGWGAQLNDNATAALVTFSEGEFWGDVHRIYISYEGQHPTLTDYMNVNKTNGTFSRINVDSCSEAYVCYEGLLDENDFESNTAYVICCGSVFKVSYVADNTWYNKTQIEGMLLSADFSSYTYIEAEPVVTVQSENNSTENAKPIDMEETAEKDFVYVMLNDGTIEISEYVGNGSSINIPTEIDGYTVSSIGKSAFRYCESIHTVNIPATVTNIEEYAFADCSLKKVSINGCAQIAAYAFYDCEALEQLMVSDGVTSIGQSAFRYSGNIQSLELPASITHMGEYAFADSGIHSLHINGCPTISNYAFYDCENLEELIISDGVTSIGQSAFRYCGSVKSLTIPNSVTTIGEYAFADSGIIALHLNGCPTIPDYAFYDCENLAAITISDGVKSIGQSAFRYCGNVEYLTIPASVTKMGEYVFADSGVQSLHFDGCQVIPNYAFYDCENLKEVVISDGVNSIGQSAFRYCSSLENVIMETENVRIGEYAFADCDRLKDVPQ